MTDGRRSPPRARPPVADPGLTRPGWTEGEFRDHDMLWLDKNENPDPALQDLLAEILRTLPATALNCYPELAPLYRKLASHLNVAADRLFLAPGSDGVIRAIFEAFVSPGDVVVHTSPTFAMYSVYCRMYGADVRPLTYGPSPDGPRLTADEVVEGIERASAKLVCLANPDSPTGTVFAPDDLRRIVAAAGRSGALILVDEAYFPFHAETAVDWTGDHDHLVVARSTGKAWGMAGFRIGYGVASPAVAFLLHKVRAMYEVGAVSAAVFDRMLDHEADMLASVDRLQAGKAAFLSAMAGLGLRTLSGAGNFMHVAFGAHADRVHAALSDLVYYRADFNDPCLKGFSRFSSAPPDMIAPVIDRIKSVCEAP